MSTVIAREDLAALARGAAILASGGGGDATTLLRWAESTAHWPVTAHSVEDLDDAMPCLAVGIGGSTFVVDERLPGTEPFADPIRAVERWTGTRAQAVCTIQVGGMGAMTALPLASERVLADADLMGRVLPRVDMFSLLADRLPGIVVACSTGGGGVLLHADARPEDVEQVLRAAFESAGGWAGVVVGGFTVGDLCDHAIPGSLDRALSLGRASLASPAHDPAAHAAAVGGRLLGSGRVYGMAADDSDHRMRTADVRCDDGIVLRLLMLDEYVACLVDGTPAALPPQIVIVTDSATNHPISTERLGVGARVAVTVVEPPPFWGAAAHRFERVSPARYGLEELMTR